MVEQQLPKLNTRVRFPSPAPFPLPEKPLSWLVLAGQASCPDKHWALVPISAKFRHFYPDFNWWREICDAGSRFATRIKKNTAFRVIETRPLAPDEDANILRDQIIELTNNTNRPWC